MAVLAAVTSHSLARIVPGSRGALWPPNGSAGQFSRQSCYAPACSACYRANAPGRPRRAAHATRSGSQDMAPSNARSCCWLSRRAAN